MNSSAQLENAHTIIHDVYAQGPKTGAVEACQSCGSTLPKPFLSLGSLPLCNELRPIDAPPAPQTTYPLELIRCDECTLVQLSYLPPAEVVFPSSYPYLSGMTRALRENFSDLAASCARTIEFRKEDLVIDIGSNDGTLLSNFLGTCRVFGVTPENAAQTANDRGIPTAQTYFSSAAARGGIGALGGAQAKLITCANCFAHVPDPHDFLEGVTTLLADNGVFVTESTYWLDTVLKEAWDTIYSEHARMLSLSSIVPMLERHGLRVFRAERIPTHGGSIRVWADRGLRDAEPSVAGLLTEETETLAPVRLDHFAYRVRLWRRAARELITDTLIGGAIHGIGAPSRASTLISYAGIDDADMAVVYEAPGSHKIGKVMPGTSIRVVEEPELFGEDQPHALMLLSHHIGKDLMPALIAKGFRGVFIDPLRLEVIHVNA